jgi:hypothetical protein
VERLQARLDVLYDDRLDGRIDAAIYDKRAKEVRDQQQRIRRRVSEAQGRCAIPTAARDRAAAFAAPGAARSDLESRELRMSLREPFEQLRLSNSATHAKHGRFGGDNGLSGIWRRERDSNPRSPQVPEIPAPRPLQTDNKG